MKRKIFSLLVAGLLSMVFAIDANCQPNLKDVGPSAMPKAIAPVKAPFRTGTIKAPAFPNRSVTVKMKKHGVSTGSIQKAIDKLSAQGGGTVVIPSGKWLTGRITLKSNINLHLSDGCELHFSGKIKDYQPIVFTRDEGIEIYSLGAFIYANGAENIAITGKGKIIGPSIDCEIYQRNHDYCLNIENIVGEKPLEQRRYDGLKTKEVFLPKSIAPINCKNVLIEGITLQKGLYWNVVPQYCDNVIIRGVTVESFGHGRTDGIDIESSRNVLVEYCSLDCQDDCYTLKSGRGWDGLRINRPTENVIIRNCLAKRGAGGIVCGTETSGGIKKVYLTDCVFDGTDQAFRFKSRRKRGGGVDSVFIERVRANVLHSALFIDLLGSVKWEAELSKRFPAREITRFTPYVKNIIIHDVDVKSQDKLFDIKGLPERPAKNIFFGNAKVQCKTIGTIYDTQTFKLKDVTVTTADSVLNLDGCDYASIYGFNNAVTGQPIKVKTVGQPSKYLCVQEFPLHPVKYNSIQSGKVWLDNNGRPIQAHGFQIFYNQDDSTYYWYGENKADALQGTNRMFGGVRLYTSKDFYNWKDEGLIIAPDSVNPMSPIHYSQKIERPHIIYCKKTGKYVCWGKSQDTDGYFVVFQADNFRGPYTFVRNLKPDGFGVGDFDMYVDPDTGKGYVWFERPHWELICADLSDDFTNVTDHYSEHFVGQRPPHTREAPTHFVHNGKHYLFTSGTTGYTSNPTEVAVFTDYHGKYTVLGDPHVGDSTASSFNSQITSVIRIPGKRELYVALADRWEPQTTGTDIPRKIFASKEKSYLNHHPVPQDKNRKPVVKNREYALVDAAHDVYKATYTFLPISFKEDKPTIEWKDDWKIEDYTQTPYERLANSFEHPADSARTKMWWFHGETTTTKEGIDADLKAFKEKGIGGVVYYDQVHSKAEGAFPAMSPEWWEMLKYAAKRAKELGLTFEVAASNGYVAGGPWITEDLGMQELAMVDTVITVKDKAQVTANLAYTKKKKKFNDIATLLFPDKPQYEDVWMLRGSRKVTNNKELTIPYDAGKEISVSTITFGSNARGKGSMGAMNMPGKPQERFFGAKYVDLPPIGDLEYSNDGHTWKSAIKLQGIEDIIGYRRNERTINFPKVSARYFRVRLHDWVGPKGEYPNLEIKDIRLSSRDKINNWEVKSGLRTEVEYPHKDGAEAGALDSRTFQNISNKMQADGIVSLTLEPGTWHIMRFGHVATGGHTKHGRKNLLGLEADVMSAKAATVQYNHYFKAIYDTLSAIGCRPDGMAMDSHEAGVANWTSGFEKKFKEQNGYDIISWLPAMEGYIIGNREKTEKALLDFRETIAETIKDEFYGTFEKLCKRDGVTFTCQAMLNIDNDNIASRGVTDKPQGEFWGYQINGNYDCLDATSAAHLYGHNIASTEAFTDTPYKTTWNELLRIANLAYCNGINEFVGCAASYQPWLDHKYADDDSQHPYIFHRLNPNWKTVGPFWEYQARCTQLLQTGKPVVDLCVYIGENPPLKTMAYKLPVIPEGYKFDVCTKDALMNRSSAKDGELAVKGGMTYKALVVQDRTYLSDEVVEKIKSLEKAGVPVVWCNKGETIANVMAKNGIKPDLAFKSADKPDDVTRFYHRSTEKADIYFVYNHSKHNYNYNVTLRTKYGYAELWNPKTLVRKNARMSKGKQVKLSLKPYESTFIIATKR